MDLLVVSNTVGKAGPAWTFLRRPEDRTEKRLYSCRPHQRPWRGRFQVLPVNGSKLVIKIVGTCVYGQGRMACTDRNTHGLKPCCEPAVVTMNDYLRCMQSFFNLARGYTLRGPESRLAPFHAVIT